MGLVRLRQQQALALIEPDGLHIDPGRLGENANGQISKLFSISLDSVHDYGSKLKPSIKIRKDTRMSEPPNGRGALFTGGLPPSSPRLAAWGRWFGRPGVQRRLDRQLDGAGTLSPHLYRRGAGGAVLRLAAHRTGQRKPANRVRSARFPKCELVTSSFSGSWPCWFWSRSDFPTSCHFSTDRRSSS
jgi:hypothetical protein